MLGGTTLGGIVGLCFGVAAHIIMYVGEFRLDDVFAIGRQIIGISALRAETMLGLCPLGGRGLHAGLFDFSHISFD